MGGQAISEFGKSEGLLIVRGVLLSHVYCAQLLVRAGAMVDALNNDGRTPLQWAVSDQLKDCAEYLLDAGAKLSNLMSTNLPQWFVAMVDKRKRCVDSCRALYGVLRKRWNMADGTRVSRDMVNVLTRQLWESRRDEKWLRK